MKRKFIKAATGSVEKMLAAMNRRIDELDVNSSCKVTGSDEVDSKCYKDTQGILGEVGEMYTEDELADIYAEGKGSDPSIDEYTSFDEWFNDTIQYMEECADIACSALTDDNCMKTSEIEENLSPISGSDAEYFDELEDADLYEDSEWELVRTKMIPDTDGFMTDYSMYRNTEDGSYGMVFGDRDIYRPEDGYFDYECDSEEEANEWFDSYEGMTDYDVEACSITGSEEVKDGMQIFDLMSYCPGTDGMESDDFACYGCFYATSLDDAKAQLEQAKEYTDILKNDEKQTGCQIYVTEHNPEMESELAYDGVEFGIANSLEELLAD